jgi:soluble lytic murein transglycosylase
MVVYTGKRGSRGRMARRSRRRRSFVVAVLLLLLLVGSLLWPRLQVAVERATHPLRYAPEIRTASSRYGVEPTLVAGVIYTESRFGYDSESSKGAYGLMQLMPSTARFVSEHSGIRGDYRDPEVNIEMGTWYLGYLERRYPGDVRLVLAAYNSGEGQVARWGLRPGFSVQKEVPYKETRDYIRSVLAAQRTYRELYGPNLSRG